MIRFRQREFSSFGTKLLFQKNQVGNSLNKIKGKLHLTKKPFLKKIPLMRQTVEQKNKIKYAKNLALTEPGAAAKEALAKVVENPVTVASAPTPLPTVLVNSIESKGLKRIKPYDKLTKSLGKGVRKLGTHKTPRVTASNSSPLVPWWERFKKYNVPSGISSMERAAKQGSKAVVVGVPLLNQY